MAKGERTFIGLYCGPSADGVDAALVRIAGQAQEMKVRQQLYLHHPLPRPLRKRLRSAASGWAMPAGDLAKLDRQLAAEFVRACEQLLRKARLERRHVAGAGAEGYAAAYVAPTPSEGSGCVLELGSGAAVARAMKLPVVSGFAASDLAAGGVGGPVWAWPDWLLFRDDRLSRVVVQLGAIASVTFVGSAAAACEVVAYDVGPGTVLIDALVRDLFESEMDEDGAAAARGKVHAALLNELLAADYFQRDPPKRTHVGDWGTVVQQRLEMMAGKHGCRARDLVATVTELTARTVSQNVLGLTERPHEVVLVGGGARNIHLAGRVRSLLSPCSTYTAERYGLDLRAHAAVCCAVLAAARLDGFGAHCPAATGAGEPTVLGAVCVP